MTRVLALVPLVGRGRLVHRSLLGTTLAERAVALVTGVADQIVVITDSPSPPSQRLLNVDRLAAPHDLPEVATRLAGADRVVVHDPLCPLVPEPFIRQLLAGSADLARVAVRPVVDTVKATAEQFVTGTVDRERLRMVSSPLIAPGSTLADLDDLETALADLTVLVAKLRAVGQVELVLAPSLSRRIEDSSDLRLVAAVDAVSHRIREHG